MVSSSAKFAVRLPTAAIFDGAQVNGNQAHVRFELPPILRFGVEARPVDELRVEVAYLRARRPGSRASIPSRATPPSRR